MVRPLITNFTMNECSLHNNEKSLVRNKNKIDDLITRYDKWMIILLDHEFVISFFFYHGDRRVK